LVVIDVTTLQAEYFATKFVAVNGTPVSRAARVRGNALQQRCLGATMRTANFIA